MMIELQEEKEKVILVGVSTSSEEETKHSLAELADLAETAGAEVVGKIVQNRDMVHAATYVGKGKLEEIKDLLWEKEATGILCDDELSPVQLRNLQEELETKVMDRTLVILDIFAARARTSEGKIQVELAQLKYRQSRLTGKGSAMSRLGGGIGTRGPGEKKLETDRRVIRHRIACLSRELAEVKRHREITRENRSRSFLPVIAIVGYTNAGKSTLLNRLTKADILAEDKLFATLDPTTRQWTLPSGRTVLLTDTVGFIRKLPHHLIEAFQSTLEEAKYADLVFHVVDSSSLQMEGQMHTVYETLDRLGIKGKPLVTIFNKVDKLSERRRMKDFRCDFQAVISARTGEGEDVLLQGVELLLREKDVLIEEVFPYDRMGVVQEIRKWGEILEEEYIQEGILVRAYVSAALWRNIENQK